MWRIVDWLDYGSIRDDLQIDAIFTVMQLHDRG